MGNSLPKLGVFREDIANDAVHLVDTMITVHHVSNGGCFEELHKAMEACNPDYMERRKPDTLKKRWRRRGRTEQVVDNEACVKATSALRQCFAANPAMFEHSYLLRMDFMLDQDVNPSLEEIKEQSATTFRWWTGMRRSDDRDDL
ncbi:unnamed protein product [Alopecurus aequalis]